MSLYTSHTAFAPLISVSFYCFLLCLPHRSCISSSDVCCCSFSVSSHIILLPLYLFILCVRIRFFCRASPTLVKVKQFFLISCFTFSSERHCSVKASLIPADLQLFFSSIAPSTTRTVAFFTEKAQRDLPREEHTKVAVKPRLFADCLNDLFGVPCVCGGPLVQPSWRKLIVHSSTVQQAVPWG